MHRRSKRILMGLGIIIVALAVTYGVLLIRATAKLCQAYAALAADGRPMQAAEILPPKVSDANNAAVLYQSAVLLLKGQPAGDKSLYERLTDRASERLGEDERRQLIGQEVVANALSLVEQGTRRPACQFEHDNGRVLQVEDAPPLDDMRNLASLMMTRARFEAQTGAPTKAWDLLVTQLRFADSLRGDLSSSTQFTRLGLAGWACRTMRRLCETAPPDRQHIRTIEDLLKRQEDIEPLIRAIDGERLLIGEWFFHLPRQELDKTLWKEKEQNKNNIAPPALLKAEHRISFLILAFKPRLLADHAAYLQLMRKRVQLLQGPYRTWRQAEEFMQIPRRSFLAYKLIGYSGSDKESYCRWLADMRVTRAGLALLQYKQAHSACSETLEALGLGELIDPFTDKPLHYRPEGEGFVVYSVGDDLKDNGGAPRREREDSDPRHKPIEYDIVWRFPNPENRDKPK
ncbi:MAG: hypothetical protein NTZ17_00350 [Phycisphaerae bacterium]|nr:hypothetical protein [Phycisphaerae bacterium]